MSSQTTRYTAVAIVLHWAIAIGIAGMIALGWWMGDALENHQTQAQAIAAFQLHKSIGITILALSIFRLVWRLTHSAPPLPDTMKPWERRVATATHWAFYALIVVMPLTGWLYVSTGWSEEAHRPLEVPTLYFGLFQVPHLFGLSHMAEQTRAALAEIFAFSHSKLAWGAIGLTILHVGAALKHQFVDRDDILGRMVPGITPDAPSAPRRTLVLAIGLGIIVLAAGAAVWAFQNPPTGAAAVSAVESRDDEGREHRGRGRGGDEHGEDGGNHESSATPNPAPAAAAAGATTWLVNRASSSITYNGAHAGIPFQGRFGAWRADIRFAPNALDQSSAVVTIDTGSASDGVPLHDQSLPGAEWFDVANYPTAIFRTSSIRARGAGAYEARATLTIKGRAIDVRLPFTLSIDGDQATMDGGLSIDRDEANLGMTSDPDADYVSKDIGVSVHVEARRAQ